MKNTSRRKARELAFQALYQRNKIGVVSEESQLFDSTELDQENRQFASEMIEQCWTNIEQVDSTIQQHLKEWRQSRLSDGLNAILRLGAAEILFIPETEGKIVINEALEICRSFLGEKPVKMCNGVLHGIWTSKNES